MNKELLSKLWERSEDKVFDYYDFLAATVHFPQEEKYAKEFELFLELPAVREDLKRLRKKHSISPSRFYEKIKKYRIIENKNSALKKQLDEIRKKGRSVESLEANYRTAQDKAREILNGFESINSKISIEEIREMLSRHDAPISWERALSWHFLTEQIIDPTSNFRCIVYLAPERERVVLEVSAEATDDDIKKQYRYVRALQKQLPGYKIKGKHKDKAAAEKIAIAQERSHPSKYSLKDREIFNEQLATMHLKQEDLSPAERKRETARQRQIKKRYKKYLPK